MVYRSSIEARETVLAASAIIENAPQLLSGSLTYTDDIAFQTSCSHTGSNSRSAR